MSDITLESITKYPIKSSAGLVVDHSLVTPRGLEHDRLWAIVDKDNKVLTGREYPDILKIKCIPGKDGITVHSQGSNTFIPFNIASNPVPIGIFSSTSFGTICSAEVNGWFSDLLHIDCRMIFMDDQSIRPVKEKHGGKPGDIVSYADDCPILLTSTSSLSDLNKQLEHPTTMNRFRPNLVVHGATPFEETTWKEIRIGECLFEVAQECQRCVFITIDPETGESHPQQEPLRTLAGYRKHPKGGASFGIHMTPRALGTIKKGDSVEVIS